MRTFTLKELTEATGLGFRTLQNWTNRGVIQCDPPIGEGGTGVHRRYTVEEAMVAAILSRLTELAIPAEQMVKAAAAIRHAYSWRKHKSRKAREAISRKIYNKILRVTPLEFRRFEAWEGFYQALDQGGELLPARPPLTNPPISKSDRGHPERSREFLFALAWHAKQGWQLRVQEYYEADQSDLIQEPLGSSVLALIVSSEAILPPIRALLAQSAE